MNYEEGIEQINFSLELATNAVIRWDKLHGEKHLVVPTVMLVKGVLTGNSGSGLYDDDENASAVPSWNHKPIVVNHPEMNGSQVSACDPDILNLRSCGVVLNTGYTDAKLHTQSWLSESRTNRIDPSIITDILSGKKVEVSTGLFLQREKVEGEFNGKKYTWKARNHRPDHLAILPGGKGASSIMDGAGLLANQAILVVNRKWDAAKRNSHPLEDFGEPHKKAFPVADQEDMDNAARLIGHADDPAATKRRLIGIAKRKGLTIPESRRATANMVVTNAMCHTEVENHLHAALAAKHGSPGKPWGGHVVDTYPNTVVYHDPPSTENISPGKGSLKAHKYEKTDKGVNLVGDPKTARAMSHYETEDGGIIRNEEGGTIPVFDKAKHVSTLIANGTFAEEDRVSLMALSETALKKIGGTAPVVTVPVPTVNNGMTDEQYIAAASPALRSIFQIAIGNQQAQKEALVNGILSVNSAMKFTKEFLMAKDIRELQGMAELVNGAVGAVAPGAGMFEPNAGLTANGWQPGRPVFVGGGGAFAPAPVVNNAPPPDENPLPSKTPLKFDKSAYSKN